MIDCLVNDQKSIMDVVSLLNINSWILAVVAVQIQSELVGNCLGDNLGCHAVFLNGRKICDN